MEDENMDLKEKLEKENRDGCLPVGLLMDRKLLYFEYIIALTNFSLL